MYIMNFSLVQMAFSTRLRRVDVDFFYLCKPNGCLTVIIADMEYLKFKLDQFNVVFFFRYNDHTRNI